MNRLLSFTSLLFLGLVQAVQAAELKPKTRSPRPKQGADESPSEQPPTMQDLTKLLVLCALAASNFALFTGCASSRHEALERHQNGYDARYDARADRRDLRSDRADARYDRGFQSW